MQGLLLLKHRTLRTSTALVGMTTRLEFETTLSGIPGPLELIIDPNIGPTMVFRPRTLTAGLHG